MAEPRKTRPKGYQDYISQSWIRDALQVYELIRRLSDDPYFRRAWVEAEVQNRCKKDTSLDAGWLTDLLYAYIEDFKFKIRKNSAGRPVVHVSPKTFRGKPYSWIFGVTAKKLSTALNWLVEEAVADVLKGYGKGSVLSGIFGKEYGKAFNRYVVHRMQEEFGK